MAPTHLTSPHPTPLSPTAHFSTAPSSFMSRDFTQEEPETFEIKDVWNPTLCVAPGRVAFFVFSLSFSPGVPICWCLSGSEPGARVCSVKVALTINSDISKALASCQTKHGDKLLPHPQHSQHLNPPATTPTTPTAFSSHTASHERGA